MHYKCIIILVLFSVKLFSQSNNDFYKKINKADTVVFTVETSGCFNAGVTVYKFCKQKNGNRKLIFTTDNKLQIKIMSSKKFALFLKKYKTSESHFSSDKPPTCTLTTDFELSDKKADSKFKNGTCENDYNPEAYLLELIK